MNTNSVKDRCFWVAMLVIAVYSLFFFATPFEPYRTADNVPPTRFWFFSYLLLPDEFFSYWIGQDGQISLLDRLPILLTTAICFLAAYGLGHIVLLFLTLYSKQIRPIISLENILFSIVLGLSVYSLFFLCLGLTGNLCFYYVQYLTGFGLLASVLIFIQWFRNREKKFQLQEFAEQLKNKIRRRFLFFVPVFIFSLLIILGGMIPSTDYDVLSYHLAGAREFAESGQIGFLSHNVYANMPFGAEMFYVWGMALTGDFFLGAMIGKTMIASTTLLTALGLYSFGKRFFSESAGLVAMILYISTPWIIYVSTAGLIDSVVGMYAFFAIYALFVSTKKSHIFITGFLAGSAAACKYPALLFVVIPILSYVTINNFRTENFRQAAMTMLIFIVAVFLACGGWYFKNYYYTGNPFYPLCFSVFGDTTGSWNTAIDARWTRIHSPHDFQLVTFAKDFWNVGVSSAWNAWLTIPFLIGSFFVSIKIAPISKRFFYFWLVFVFASWWFLTHRIDRFWIPAVPVLTLLAGAGATCCDKKYWKISVTVLMVISCIYCFIISALPAPGKNASYFASLESMRRNENISTSWAVWFNAHPPENRGKILLIGEAKSFLYEVPILYNTCFNETPLKEILSAKNTALEFQRRGITFVLVDWAEIARFRSPGNYGYSEFVTPELFEKLVTDKVLKRYCPTKDFEKSSTILYVVNDQVDE